MKSLPIIGLALAALLIAASRADAENQLWTGNGGINWNDASNWDPNTDFPQAGDNAFFDLDANVLVIVGAPSAADNVTFSDGTVTVAGGTLNIGNTTTIDDPNATTLLNGPVVIDNGPVWNNTVNTIVGDVGAGELQISGSGDFTTFNLFIGDDPNSIGKVDVAGGGSSLTITSTGDGDGIFVGNQGAGTLNVTGGATVDFTDVSGGIPNIFVGHQAAGNGTLLIDGAGTVVTAEDSYIGNNGAAQVTVSGGGHFDQTIGSSPNALVAQQVGSSGDVTVTGDNSRWQTARLEIGNLGDATLSVEAGGLVRSNSNDMALGDAGGSGRVAVFGAGSSASSLEVTNDLYVGSAGQGVIYVGQDLLENPDGNGSLVVGSDLFIGNNSGNTADNRLVVSGANATASVGDILRVGSAGRGTMEVLNGAKVTNARGRIGEFGDPNAEGVVTVSDPNSSWDMTGDLIVGVQGGTGTLNVTGGAFVGSDGSAAFGHLAGSRGTVLVSGPGSQLAPVDDNNSGVDVLIGNSGTGDVTVEDGGFFFVETEIYMANGASGNGRLKVQDAGSLAMIGENPASGANELFIVGQAGRARVEILNGGKIENERTVINNIAPDMAVYGEAFTETFLVSGVDDNDSPGDPNDDTPSTLRTFGRIEVGSTRQASLRIADGGQVISNDGIARGGSGDGLTIIGNSSTADNSSVLITGTGSKWFDAYDPNTDTQDDNDFVVANSATGVTLDIEDGGALQTGRGVVARLAGSSATVTITGAGSRWDATSMIIGNIGIGTVNVTNGGTVVSAGLTELGNNNSAADGILMVDGTGSSYTSSSFSLGDISGGDGTVMVTDGGVVTATDVFNVAEVGGANGFATVGTTDPNDNTAMLNVGTNLNVGGNEGGQGGDGDLEVLPTGVVNVTGALRVFDEGTVYLDGGTINTATFETLPLPEFPDPTFNFNSGTFRFTGGATLDAGTVGDLLGSNQTLVADQHLAVVGTAVLSTPLRLNGGQLSVGSVSAASLANLDWDAGTLNITAQTLTVGAAGQLGQSVIVDQNQALNIPNGSFEINVEAGADLNVIRGELTAASTTNDGLIVISNTTGVDFDVDNAGAGLTNNGDLVAIDSTIAGPVQNNGTIEIIGTVNFTDGVTLAASSTLGFDIDGLLDFDVLSVGDDLSLDGSLDLDVSNSFALTAGDSFQIIDVTGTTSGTFAGLPDGALVGNFGGVDLFIDYDAGDGNDVALFTTGLPGDFDFDNDVDGADFLVWQRDPNVGLLSDWEANYGTVLPPPIVSAAKAVPEPSALALVLLTAISLASRRRLRG